MDHIFLVLSMPCNFVLDSRHEDFLLFNAGFCISLERTGLWFHEVVKFLADQFHLWGLPLDFVKAGLR